MGAICGCLEDGGVSALAHLSTEDRASVGAIKMKQSSYTGPLYTLYKLDTSQDPKMIDFKPPSGIYSHFHTNARLMHANTDDGTSQLTPNGNIVLSPNYKIELGMFLIKDLFVNDRVTLHVRMDLEEGQPTNLEQYATITVSSRRTGNKFTEVYNNIPVFAHSKMIDFGFEPSNLVMNEREATPIGDSCIQIIYKEESGKQPIKIKQITVYTQQAASESLVEKNLVTITKNEDKFVCAKLTDFDAQTAKAFGDLPIAQIMDPKLTEGIVNFNDQIQFMIYANDDNEMKMFVQFDVNPAILSMLVRNFTRRLLLRLRMKASDSQINFRVNNKVQLLDGAESKQIGKNEEEVVLELDYRSVTVNNVLKIRSDGPVKYIGIRSISLDLV